jgi:hypothetical protein
MDFTRPPRYTPEDCMLFKQVLDVGRHFGVEPEPHFERALLHFAYMCQLKMYEKMREEMMKPPRPIIIYSPIEEAEKRYKLALQGGSEHKWR